MLPSLTSWLTKWCFPAPDVIATTISLSLPWTVTFHFREGVWISVGPSMCLLWPVLGWSGSTVHCACVQVNTSGMLEFCLLKSLKLPSWAWYKMLLRAFKPLLCLSALTQSWGTWRSSALCGLALFVALALTFAVATSCNYIISWEPLKLFLSWRWK